MEYRNELLTKLSQTKKLQRFYCAENRHKTLINLEYLYLDDEICPSSPSNLKDTMERRSLMLECRARGYEPLSVRSGSQSPVRPRTGSSVWRTDELIRANM